MHDDAAREPDATLWSVVVFSGVSQRLQRTRGCRGWRRPTIVAPTIVRVVVAYGSYREAERWARCQHFAGYTIAPMLFDTRQPATPPPDALTVTAPLSVVAGHRKTVSTATPLAYTSDRWGESRQDEGQDGYRDVR